jgi:hypothetical protein
MEAGKTEPDWTKSISNETVCSYFYILFFIVTAFAAIAVGLDIMVAVKRPAAGLGLLLRSAPTLILAILNSLFFYIICVRSLLK